MNSKIKVLLFSLALILAFSATTRAQSSTDTVKTAVIKVTNLHCNGDMPTIKKRLLNQEGVDEVVFTDRTGTASTFTIKYHNAAITETTIEKAIETTPGCDDETETPYRVKRDKSKKKKS